MARLLVLGAAALLLAACGSSGGEGQVSSFPVATQAPDFTLLDENPGSPTFGAPTSPRDHLGRVTAWFFDDAAAAVPT